MKVLVLGANGRVGSLVVSELLAAGYQVKGFVHSDSHFEASDSLEIIQGDIYNQNDISQAIIGCDAVVSTLGSWGTKNKDILTQAMMGLVPAMREAGIRRIVSLTGASAFDTADTPSVIDKLTRRMLMVVAPKILHDGEEHMRILRQSGLDWTVLRSPVMRESGGRGFRLTFKFPSLVASINRHDVATAMKEILDTNSYIQAAPFIHRS